MSTLRIKRSKVNSVGRIFLGKTVRALGWSSGERLYCIPIGEDEVVCRAAEEDHYSNARIYKGYYLKGLQGVLPFEENEEVLCLFVLDEHGARLILRRANSKEYDLVVDWDNLLYTILGMFGIDEADKNKKFGIRVVSESPIGIHISPIEG